eukprot:TRINITY_DN18105_c0_g1_i1.p1 TRINITY_DN18105_c0_g1~~TRINITY_DN18105_c0_g1_i1.p1  ORF type:complete len:655 (+),score=221.26 TRINITY_DN18105_c0_g1_i1:2-1966(+)
MVPEIHVTDENPPMFELEWLDGCSEKIKFGGSGTNEILTEVNKQLSFKIRGEFSNKFRQQAMFELLGQDYAQLHFPHHQYAPELLRSPNLQPVKREELLSEMRDLLDNLLVESLDELGYPRDMSTYKGNTALEEFLEDIRHTFKSESENQVQQRIAFENREKENTIEDDVVSLISQASAEEEGEEVHEKLEKLKFRKSDVLGEALCAIVANDSTGRSSLMDKFAESFLMFPNPLRKIIWEGFIADIQQKDSGKRKSKKKAERDFKAEIKKKMKGGTQRAVQSSDYKTIFSAVIDTYHNNKVLKPFANDNHMLQTAHIINIVNVFDKEYSTAQIYWVLPYQILYEQGDGGYEEEEKHMIEMSSILQKFSRFGPLKWSDVNEAAQKVVGELKQLDTELYDHLKKVLDESIHATSMLHFVVPEVLLSNTKKSQKMWSDLNKKKKKEWKPKDHDPFGKLDLWIRKWISEAFAGIMCREELLYVWDILFMHNWKMDIFVTMSLLFLGMIKPWLMKAENNKQCVSIMLEEPTKLYMRDIRNGLQLDIRTQFSDLQNINTNYVAQVEKEEPPEEQPDENAEKEEKKEDEENNEEQDGTEKDNNNPEVNVEDDKNEGEEQKEEEEKEENNNEEKKEESEDSKQEETQEENEEPKQDEEEQNE